jgi:hypothetical protein
MMFQVLKDSCNRGDQMLDFGSGEGEHKRRLRTRTETTYRLTYTPIDSWRSQVVRLTRWAKNRWPNARESKPIAAATGGSPVG